MQRFLRLIIWDALFYVVPTIGYAASAALTSYNANYIVTLLTCGVCGAFLAQLSRWGTGRMEVIVVGVPGAYLALAPFLAPWLNVLPLSFDPIPAILLTTQTLSLRIAGSLVAGFVMWQHMFISIAHRR